MFHLEHESSILVTWL